MDPLPTWDGRAFDGAKIALIHGEQVIAYLRDDKPDLPWPGLWDLPGGGREGDETPIGCALREVEEEFGVVLDPGCIVHVAAHPAAAADGFPQYFLVGRITAAQIAAIRFGPEGQRWRLMPIAAFLAEPRAVAPLQRRLRTVLNGSGAMRPAPSIPADPAVRARAAGSGGPPSSGFAALVPELDVDDIAASLAFWCGPLGFTVSYDRPAARFAYLERDGAQVMLCGRNGRWDTGALARPYGRGVNLQITVAALQPIVDGLAGIGWPLFATPAEAWYRAGPVERGQREMLVQDPDGYLLRFAEILGLREAASGG